ncbi:putative multidrug resistance protein fnx1 [Aaosphaeria arxii CBS 175.79]|uniref:Putative multidrug resistance protein fnx1 n=1 Tax=Aaosphaeria arxii CBS 175.79 TaxID=1450172 RepID=A0A6A5XTX4_9PLEO|nr:putative multidrug resistance protein fnx1 [Aaosphaeria arxii CBS 175.79]KAF2016768.1 putative multidrug resistance protein fnx1 [Aaosphaeria arxii CBS 175.79]
MDETDIDGLHREQRVRTSHQNELHEQPEKTESPEEMVENSHYPQGIRFWLITIAISIALFLTNLEIPIVTTSVVAITDDIGGFDKSGWLISSYLLGYVGVVVIFAKLSDILGRKLLLATAIIIFIIGSAACGASQTIVQLIVFRAIQGIGGGGCFAVGITMITDLESSIPCAAPALAFTVFAIPPGFHGAPIERPVSPARKFLGKEVRDRMDFLGGILLLLATLALTAGFHEANAAFPWRSAYVITLLTSSILLWFALVYWERKVTLANDMREPVLPWVFLANRVVLGLLLDSLFLGGSWFVGVFTLPQRYQIVHATSALQAGIRTMPFTFAAPLGAAWSSAATGKYKIPPIFILMVSASLQILGFALLATLPNSVAVPARSYGFQIVAGFGCGITISLPALVIPFLVEIKHRAVGLGAIGQTRIMGGSIVLAIASSVFHSYTRPRLQNLTGSKEVATHSGWSQGSIPSDEVRHIIARGYDLQMLVLCGCGGAQLLAILLMWRRKQVVIG